MKKDIKMMKGCSGGEGGEENSDGGGVGQRRREKAELGGK